MQCKLDVKTSCFRSEQETYTAEVTENSPIGDLVVPSPRNRRDRVPSDTNKHNEVQYFFTSRTQALYGQIFGICNTSGQITVDSTKVAKITISGLTMSDMFQLKQAYSQMD